MKLIYGLVTLLALALGSSAANATGPIRMHGNACSAAPGSAGNNLVFNGYGWTSNANSGNHVICGITLPGSAGAPQGGSVTAYNRSNQPVGYVCTLNALDSNGNLVFGGSPQTTPQPYATNAQTINLLSGNQSIPSTAVYLTVDCFIPGPSVTSGPTMSHLSGITINTQF